MSDVTRCGAGTSCPAESMPAMIGRPFAATGATAAEAGLTVKQENAAPGAGAATSWSPAVSLRPQRRPEFAFAGRAFAGLFATWAVPVFAVILAAAFGALAGSLTTVSLAGFGPGRQDSAARAETIAALGDQIARMKSEISALKSGIDHTDKTANAKIGKLAERMERNERKIALAAASRETTGSLPVQKLAAATPPGPPPAIAAPATVPAATPAASSRGASPATQPSTAPLAAVLPKSTILEGWRLRGVFSGMAIVDSRFGPMEVEIGDLLPGGIRVETIQRREGHWVVVTNRGLITSR